MLIPGINIHPYSDIPKGNAKNIAIDIKAKGSEIAAPPP